MRADWNAPSRRPSCLRVPCQNRVISVIASIFSGLARSCPMPADPRIDPSSLGWWMMHRTGFFRLPHGCAKTDEFQELAGIDAQR